MCGGRRSGLRSFGRGQEHGVDHVDDAIGGLDVGGDDVGIADLDRATVDGDRGGCALDGGDILTVELHDLGGGDAASDDVVGENLDELILVLGLQQVFDRAGGQFGEGFVGRSEDGEGARALQRVDQAGGLDGGDQGAEVGVAGGGVDDVLVSGQGRCGHTKAERDHHQGTHGRISREGVKT